MNFENIRLDFEYTINGCELEDGKYLHVKQEDGHGAIFSINQFTNPRTNKLKFMLIPIRRSASYNAYFLNATVDDIKRHINSNSITFEVLNHKNNELNIEELMSEDDSIIF